MKKVAKEIGKEELDMLVEKNLWNGAGAEIGTEIRSGGDVVAGYRAGREARERSREQTTEKYRHLFMA